MQLDRWYPAQCCQIQPERQYIFLWVFSTSRCFPERLIKQQQQRGAIQNRLGFEKTAFLLCIEKWQCSRRQCMSAHQWSFGLICDISIHFCLNCTEILDNLRRCMSDLRGCDQTMCGVDINFCRYELLHFLWIYENKTYWVDLSLLLCYREK